MKCLGWMGAVVGLVLVVGGLALLAGCGGASPPAGSDQAATLVVRIHWPEQAGEGRFIPLATKSVKGMIYGQGDASFTIQRSGWVNYPGDLVITNVPPGPKDLRVWACDALGGTGNALAFGISQVLILGGRENATSIHLHAGKLVFASDRDGDYEIYRATPDMRYVTQITSNTVNDYTPAGAPNGTKIAYSRYGVYPAGYSIRIYDNATASDTVFADLSGDDRAPAWSPNSRTIAWINYYEEAYKLCKKNVDGTGYAELSLGAADSWKPTWSPDGTRIAFQRNVDGDDDIFVAWADLSTFWPVTDNNVADRYPVWSPQDNGVIYLSHAAGAGGSLQLARLTGSFYEGTTPTLTVLTDEPWAHSLWDISPDGSQLAYSAIEPMVDDMEVFYWDLQTSDSIRVTYTPGMDMYPCFLRPTTADTTVDAY